MVIVSETAEVITDTAQCTLGRENDSIMGYFDNGNKILMRKFKSRDEAIRALEGICIQLERGATIILI